MVCKPFEKTDSICCIMLSGPFTIVGLITNLDYITQAFFVSGKFVFYCLSKLTDNITGRQPLNEQGEPSTAETAR